MGYRGETPAPRRSANPSVSLAADSSPVKGSLYACAFRESHGFEKQLAQPKRRRRKPPSRGRWIREVALDRTKTEGVSRSGLLSFLLFVVFRAASSFSLPRKKQYRPLSDARSAKGFAPSMQALTALVVLKHDLMRARGDARISTIDCHLTFTHHFRLRRSPHWGHVMRKRPLDSPRLSMLGLAWRCTPLQRPRGGVPRLVL